MNITAIIQARMGSTRLPGKVLKKIKNKTILEYQLERVRRAALINETIVATSTNDIDNVIVELCNELGVRVYRGSETDVLSRYYEAAIESGAEVVVRLTSDCPLIDPEVIDQVIKLYLDYTDVDYVSNAIERTFPRGLDTEVFSMEALQVTFKNAVLPSEREHVTAYMYSHPERFNLLNFSSERDLSKHRWTVDTIEDFELIERILTSLYPHNPHFTFHDVLHLLDENPSWALINGHIEQKKI